MSVQGHANRDILWLGSLPAHWTVRPLWSMFRRIKDIEHPDEPMLSVFRDYGVVLKESRENLNTTAENRNIYQLVHPGWLVVNRMKAWQGSVGISPYRGIVSGHYLCFAPTHDEHPEYLNWLFRSSACITAYRLLSRGVRPGQAEIDNDLYRKMSVILPPIGEQRRITRFLDREMAQVDALTAKQGQLVEVLRERRAAKVAAVIGSAPIATSGLRLKHWVRSVVQGWSPQCYAWPADGIQTWGVLKVGAVNNGVFRPMENKQLPDDHVPRPDLVVRPGQLLVSRANTRELVGSAAPVEDEYPRLMLSDKLYAFTLDDCRVLPKYVALVLGTRRWRDLIELCTVGASSSMQNISQSDIVNLPMDLPSIGDQARVLREIQQSSSRIDAMIAKAEEFIALARERRAALITEAVTGRVDVSTGKVREGV